MLLFEMLWMFFLIYKIDYLFLQYRIYPLQKILFIILINMFASIITMLMKLPQPVPFVLDVINFLFTLCVWMGSTLWTVLLAFALSPFTACGWVLTTLWAYIYPFLGLGVLLFGVALCLGGCVVALTPPPYHAGYTCF